MRLHPQGTIGNAIGEFEGYKTTFGDLLVFFLVSLYIQDWQTFVCIGFH